MAERTLIILKPDAVQRGLIGPVISRFEQKGLQLVGCKFMQIPRELAEKHYAVHQGKPFYDRLLTYITSGPVLVMVYQAAGAIAMARKLMGATFGCEAEPGTIRGDFGGSRGFNLVHGSDSPQAAQQEIELYFTKDELVDYDLTNAHWLYGMEE